ncbi:MAG: PQQ-binding-like beta-propeller repeat protein [Deltaproteobacteria bacterium]|nr:PQQ-binding-like beta-propeller repeat protein [Deltaproteobacteria bacterium]
MTAVRGKLSLALVVVLAGCGGAISGGRFHSRFPDNQAPAIRSVVSRVSSAGSDADTRAIVVGVARDRVVAYDLAAGRQLWTRPASGSSVPIVAGPMVVLSAGGRILGLDLASGAERFDEADEGLSLVGAGGDASRVAVALSAGSGAGGSRSVLRVYSASGGSIWEVSGEHAFGRPAVAGGLVFLPWDQQNLSVLDRGGDEIARVRIGDDVVAHAFSDRGAVYFGERGVFRFDERAASGSRTSASYYAPTGREDLPGAPRFMPQGYRAVPAATSAESSLHLAWRPATGGEGLALDGDTLYAIFFRAVLGIDARSGDLKWAYVHPRDIVGTRVVSGGLLVACRGGTVTLIDRDSGTAPRGVSVGQPLVSAAFTGGDWSPGGSGDASSTLGDQLLALARVSDARLVPARRFAVRRLARLDDSAVTEHLIAIAGDPAIPPQVRQEAGTALAARTSGIEHMLAALEQHRSFLRNTSGPPVGYIARALAAAGAREGVPGLIAHLQDPSTPVEAMPDIVQALRTLGDRAAVEPIRSFLLLYHAEAPDEMLGNALTVAVEALARLGGADELPVIRAVAEAPWTLLPVRQAAQVQLAALERAAATAAAAQQPPPQQGGAEGGDTTAPAGGGEQAGAGGEAGGEGGEGVVIEAGTGPAGDPRVLTGAQLDAAFLEQRPILVRCLGSAPGRPLSARVTFVVTGEGVVQRVLVHPESVRACVEPIVRGMTFPLEGSRTQQYSYTIRR